MRHRMFGKQLSRNTAHRRALRRNQAASLFQHGAIKTTEAKAKELRPFVERLITIARRNTLAARRQVISLLRDRDMVDNEGKLEDQSVIQKLFSDVAPKYADRPGGYTRIIRLSDRRIGDGGVQVILQLVEESKAAAPASPAQSRRRRRAAKKISAAEAGAPAADAEEAAGESPADQQAE
ncbi:MAG TPA: 50S ribosomal protein L17 [Phycisphaerae bacterium]|nr:50S ribosomal protein L17 [Phycisphaerae bacterium]HQL72868.1 50S ribosomal protein L17 [Phycisphaerae bacterium]